MYRYKQTKENYRNLANT